MRESASPPRVVAVTAVCSKTWAGVIQKDLVDAVAFDMQRRALVAKVAETHLPDSVVPNHGATGLLDKAFSIDLVRHTAQVSVLPEVRNQALANDKARMFFLFKQDNVVALLGQQGCSRAAGRSATNHDDIGACWDFHGCFNRTWVGGFRVASRLWHLRRGPRDRQPDPISRTELARDLNQASMICINLSC